MRVRRPTKQLRKKELLRAWLAYLNMTALSWERAVSSTSWATVLRLSSTSEECILASAMPVRDEGTYRDIPHSDGQVGLVGTRARPFGGFGET